MFIYCSAFMIPSLLIALADLPYQGKLKDDKYEYVYSVKSLEAENYATAVDVYGHKLIVNLKCKRVEDWGKVVVLKD